MRDYVERAASPVEPLAAVVRNELVDTRAAEEAGSEVDAPGVAIGGLYLSSSFRNSRAELCLVLKTLEIMALASLSLTLTCGKVLTAEVSAHALAACTAYARPWLTTHLL